MRRSKSVVLDDEMKATIKALPEKKKNQLLLRLVRKDAKLVDQIRYEYIENEETQELRREELEESFDEILSDLQTRDIALSWWLSHIRGMSSKITWHAQVTKDKFGDIYLNLMVINRVMKMIDDMYEDDMQNYRLDAYAIGRIYEYFVRRLKRLVKAMDKLHEDLFLELSDEWRIVAFYFNNNKFLEEAKYHELYPSDVENFF